jgi:precorrin-4 methylase
MAQQSPDIHFEDIPLAEARTMGWGPRMDPELYQALKGKIQSLDNTATRITILEGTSLATMKNRLLRVAAELEIPLTIRKVPGGLLFWRSTAEDLEQAKEVVQRLQPARRQGRARPGQRRR